MDTPEHIDVDLTAVEEAKVFPEGPPPEAHIMLDLETWGCGNKAAIVSIGACKFDADRIIDSFHVAVDPESCQHYGLEFDASTLIWWFDPEREEARRNWLSHERVELSSALLGFQMWVAGDHLIKAMWGNGSTFDNIILRSAFAATQQEYPVKFWQDHCYRTLKSYAPQVELVREGVHHNALDDAISQAKHLQAIARELGIEL